LHHQLHRKYSASGQSPRSFLTLKGFCGRKFSGKKILEPENLWAIFLSAIIFGKNFFQAKKFRAKEFFKRKKDPVLLPGNLVNKSGCSGVHRSVCHGAFLQKNLGPEKVRAKKFQIQKFPDKFFSDLKNFGAQRLSRTKFFCQKISRSKNSGLI